MSSEVHREIAKGAGEQKRGSNKARYGIIKGLKPFQLAP
jgi:hypothetical protein